MKMKAIINYCNEEATVEISVIGDEQTTTYSMATDDRNVSNWLDMLLFLQNFGVEDITVYDYGKNENALYNECINVLRGFTYLVHYNFKIV